MQLSDKDYGRIQTFYQKALQKFGPADPRSLHWGTLNDQYRRFDVLASISDLQHSSLLDVGCGTGDLYKYLLSQAIEVDYTGIDIVPEFIEAAKQRFPQGYFLHQDIFEIQDHYDYVLASGALSFKVQDNAHYYQTMIGKMFQIANKGLAFNMLDRHIHTDNEIYAAYDPQEIASFCQTLTSNVQIQTDYLPQDFTIYMFK